jgi:hypothetical protein
MACGRSIIFQELPAADAKPDPEHGEGRSGPGLSAGVRTSARRVEALSQVAEQG